MNLENHERRALRPDAQAFDEVRIVTLPRYKTSELSGDEWRISAKVELLRKGRVIVEEGCRNVEVACKLLAWYHCKACDDGNGFFAGEGDLCDQEGCAAIATVTYRVLNEFCRDHPHEHQKPLTDEVVTRKFCAQHSKRGDCGFDDADKNYVALVG